VTITESAEILVRLLATVSDAPVLLIDAEGRIIGHAGTTGITLPATIVPAQLALLIPGAVDVAVELDGRVWSATALPWRHHEDRTVIRLRSPGLMAGGLADGQIVGGADQTGEVAAALSRARRAEDRARRDAEQLAAANRELERYASLVAHDLRAPVRSARLLGERALHAALVLHDHQLAAELGDHLTRALTRIDDLICRLIDYGSVIDHQPRPRLLRGSPFLATCVETAAAGWPDEAGLLAAVTVGATDDLVADPAFLIPVVAELVTNAIKHRHPDRAAAVALESSRQGPVTAITVTDNGLGIPERDRARAFELFARLHSGVDTDGVGFGLAYCRRALEHHGGVITLDTGPGGRGTRATVTLPWPT
jgi:signal transduction histidine kinase